MKKTVLLAAALLWAAAAQAQTVDLETTAGQITLQLDAEKAPKTVANFLQYVKSGHYNGVIFHRVIKGFMIQTGGYDIHLKQRPTKPPIPLESNNGLSNLTGTVAMARTSDPNSATAQFFINLVDNVMLDPRPDNPGYAVFGKVSAGMDVVAAIGDTPVAPLNAIHQNAPVEPVIIKKATIRK